MRVAQKRERISSYTSTRDSVTKGMHAYPYREPTDNCEKLHAKKTPHTDSHKEK